VSEPERTTEIHRILIALDASPGNLEALEAAVELAARMEAELSGVFVEDTELLRLADSPFCREIRFATATEAPLNRAGLESTWKAQSERARSALAAAAQRARVHWTFRTVRDRVATAVVSVAGSTDLLVVTRIGSAQVEATTIPLLFLPDRGVSPSLQVLVYYDGSPAAKRGLQAGAQLCKSRRNGMTVLLAATDPASESSLKKEAIEVLAGRGAHLQFRRVDPNNPLALLRAVAAESAGILILGGRDYLKQLQPLEALLRAAGIPLLVLGSA
jgi:nucleotide-binding universal stress UspA family protein